MKQIFKIISIFILVFFVSCGSEDNGLSDGNKIATTETKNKSNNTTKIEAIETVEELNNTITTIEVGRKLFVSNCVVCHGVSAVGLYKDWKVKVNGKYLAPPLNGTSHAWNHSRELLANIIKKGSMKNGGNMPSFTHLSKDNIENILDYLYDLWPENIKKAHDKLE